MAMTPTPDHPSVPSREELWAALYPGVRPYESFRVMADAWPLDFSPDFDGTNPLLADAAREAAVGGSLIVEVGTWKGLSAKALATACPAATLLCVDTFCGNVEHWLARDADSVLPYQLSTRLWHHGRPALYQQFLANVIKLGLTDRLIPFPITSVEAARWCAHHGILCDLVYLDAGHSFVDVLLDLKAWWPIVRPGGTLIGHDYGGRHAGVEQAVTLFAANADIEIDVLGGQFYQMQKQVDGSREPVAGSRGEAVEEEAGGAL